MRGVEKWPGLLDLKRDGRPGYVSARASEVLEEVERRKRKKGPSRKNILRHLLIFFRLAGAAGDHGGCMRQAQQEPAYLRVRACGVAGGKPAGASSMTSIHPLHPIQSCYLSTERERERERCLYVHSTCTALHCSLLFEPASPRPHPRSPQPIGQREIANKICDGPTLDLPTGQSTGQDGGLVCNHCSAL